MATIHGQGKPAHSHTTAGITRHRVTRTTGLEGETMTMAGGVSVSGANMYTEIRYIYIYRNEFGSRVPSVRHGPLES